MLSFGVMKRGVINDSIEVVLGQPYRGTWGYPNFRLWYLPDKPRPYLALLLISFAV